ATFSLKLNTVCFPSTPIESDYLKLSHLVLLEPSPNSRSFSASQNLAQCRLGVEADHEKLGYAFAEDECGAAAIEYRLMALLRLASQLSRLSVLSPPWFEAPTGRIIEVQTRGSRRPWRSDVASWASTRPSAPLTRRRVRCPHHPCGRFLACSMAI